METTDIESRIDMARSIIEAHEAYILKSFTTLKLRFLGSGKVTTTISKLESESDVMDYMEMTVQADGLVATPRSPLKYWKQIIQSTMDTLKRKQMAEFAHKLSYNKQEATEATTLATFTKLLTGEDSSVNTAVMAHFLWQIKRKLNKLPISYHMMPVIWGKTGVGKSEALRKLMGPISGYVLTGMSLDKIGDDRYYRQLADHLVAFFDEMPKVDKAPVEHIKQVITADELTGRILYSNGYKAYKQNCTFIGTSNESPSQLIKDTTGMRRFHYIKCADRIDWDSINRLDYVKLWQEINEFRETPYIATVREELKVKQEEVRQRDAIEEFINEGYLDASATDSKFKSKDAYELFKEYSKDSGYYLFSKQNFNRQLQERYGFKKVTDGSKHDLLFPSFYGKLNKNPSKLEGKGL